MKIREDLQNTSREEIIALDDETINNALYFPDAPKWVYRIFNFLVENQNIVTTTGGMKPSVTGFDRYKLDMLAERLYKFDLSRWMYPVKLFEDSLIEYQNKSD